MTSMKYSVNSLQMLFLCNSIWKQSPAAALNAHSEAFTNLDLLSGLNLKQSPTGNQRGRTTLPRRELNLPTNVFINVKKIMQLY